MPRSLTVVIPSRTGNVTALRAQLAQQSFKDWELRVAAGVSPAARARNRGARGALSDWLLFIDDDVSLGHPHVIAELVEALRSVGPKTAVGVARKLPAGCNAFQRRYEAQSFDDRLFPRGEGLLRVGWNVLGTACLAIPRQTFESLGGFDESLIAGEDFDLCYRLQAQEGAAYLASGSWIYHAPPRNLLQAIRKTVWYEQGNVQLARKYPNAGHRMALRGWLHAVAYLLLRTLAWPILCFVKLSYQHRRPQIRWRPEAALLSYIGAWAYTYAWFFRPKPAGADASDAPTAPSSEPLRSLESAHAD